MALSRIKLDTHVRELLKKASGARRSLQVFVPTATAIAAALKLLTPTDASESVKAASATSQILLLLFIALAGVVLLFTDKSATTVIHDAQLAIDEAEQARAAVAEMETITSELEAQIARQTRLEDVLEAMRAVVDVALRQPEISPQQLEEWLTDLLDFLVADKLSLFGMGDEQWNFSIYLFDQEAQELRCLVTRRPTTREEQAPHRSWREGEGHVGKAYQDRRPLVCSDSTEPNVRGFFDAPGAKLRDYDLDRYRSLAAIPIQSDDEVPVGVLVATSAVAGRFLPEDEETVSPLLSLARTLATLLAIYNLGRRTEGNFDASGRGRH